MSSLLEEHNRLLAEMPPGAVHATENCFVCQDELDKAPGGVMTTTFTEADVLTAVEKAVRPLQEKIAELESIQAEEVTAQKIAEIKAELEQSIAELTADRDRELARANLAEKALADYQAELEALSAQAEAEERAQAIRLERRSAVAELGCFTEAEIDARIEGWVAQAEEVFATTVGDLKALVARQARTPVEEEKPPATAMQTVRTPESNTSIFSELAELRNKGVDLRAVSL